MYKESVNEKFLKKLEIIERHVERKLSKNKGKKKNYLICNDIDSIN